MNINSAQQGMVYRQEVMHTTPDVRIPVLGELSDTFHDEQAAIKCPAGRRGVMYWL